MLHLPLELGHEGGRVPIAVWLEVGKAKANFFRKQPFAHARPEWVGGAALNAYLLCDYYVIAM